MSLFNEVGWFAGFFNRPILYHSEYLTTVQDYVKREKVTTSVYNRTRRKRHSITIAVPTNKRDSAKSLRATFAN